MKILAVAALLAVSCATTGENPYAYNEAESCPANMDAQQQASGAVRCSAMCASYARDFAEFDSECKCRCRPAAGSGGYRPQAQQRRDAHTNEM